MKKIVLTALLGICTISPVLAANRLERFFDGIATFLITLAVIWGIFMLIPIVTATIAINTQNEGLKKFSKVYSQAWVIMIALQGISNASFTGVPFTLLFMGIAAIPLFILKADKNKPGDDAAPPPSNN